MTVEPEKDDYPEKRKSRFRSGHKRRERAIKRNHLRELEALESRSEAGPELNSRERGRLSLLREMYK